jgi:serine/threonine-protein kinase
MATNAEPMWRAGDVVGGRYRLAELIGSGGMSVVWRAHDEVLDRPVAVKMLSRAGSQRFRIQLRAEARAYGRLNTPRIAQVYDYGETETAAPYLVMEYVAGEALSDRLRDGAMPWTAAIAMAAQIADALRDAHAHGLVHRDIKPDNVILTDAGAKLVDFGICAMIGAPDADADGRLLGTPAYLAPERIADAPVQPAADVYGLGVLLYRALTGGLPWRADTSTGLLRAHMFAEPMPMPAIDELPPDVAQICVACLDKDPHARPSSAELANTLWLATLTSNAPTSPAPSFFANIAPTSPAPPSPAAASPRKPASMSPGAMAGKPTEAFEGTSAIQPDASVDRPDLSTGWPGRSVDQPGRTPDAPHPTIPPTRRRSGSAVSMTHSLSRSDRAVVGDRATGLASPTEQPAGRRRAYMFAAAIVTISLALLGVAWGALGPGDGSGATYAGASPCFANFAVDRDWGDGFAGHVTVTNASDVALRGWRLEFAFPGGQHLSPASATTAGTTNTGNTDTGNANAGNAKAVAMTNSAGQVTVTPTEGKPYVAAITQTGKTVVAQTVGTPALAVSQSVVVPISASYSGVNRMPTAVALNGTDCQTQAPTPATTTATPDPTRTATTTAGSSGKGGGEDGTEKGHGGHGKSGGHSGKG